MQPIEVIVIVATLTFVLGYIGVYLYKRYHNIPTGDCSVCKKRMSKMVKKLQKDYRKQNKSSCSSSNCTCKSK